MVLWMALFWGIGWVFNWAAIFPEIHWFPMILLGLGIYLYRDKPLRLTGFSQPVESAVITSCGIIFVLHLGWIFLVPRLAEEEQNSLPCSAKSIEVQCYTFSQENCSAVWDHYSKECTEEVKRTIVSRRSTVLTGPIVRRCIYKRLDQSFRSNRRTPLNDRCNEFFNSLDGSRE
jgi:hypothetical protein